jgi:hypothetical protein
VVALKAKNMIEGVTKPHLIKQDKAEFASLVIYLMTSVGKFRQSTEERNQLYLGRLAHGLKQTLPQLTLLFKRINSIEPCFIYKQELQEGTPELVVGTSVIIALDNIVKSIQPSLDSPIANDGFNEIVKECKKQVETF